jgi:hypothetical protein
MSVQGSCKMCRPYLQVTKNRVAFVEVSIPFVELLLELSKLSRYLIDRRHSVIAVK